MGAKELYKEIKEKEMVSMINHSFYKFAVIDEMKFEHMDNEWLKALIETNFICFTEFKSVLALIKYSMENFTQEEITSIESENPKDIIRRYKYTYNNIKEIGYHDFKAIPNIDRLFYRADSSGLFYFFIMHNSLNISYLFDAESKKKINSIIKKYRGLNYEGDIICKDCKKFNQEIIDVLNLNPTNIYEEIYHIKLTNW